MAWLVLKGVEGDRVHRVLLSCCRIRDPILPRDLQLGSSCSSSAWQSCQRVVEEGEFARPRRNPDRSRNCLAKDSI